MFINLLLRYGYVTIFVAAAIEGDATLLTGTFLAHRGHLHLDVVMIVAASGTIAINQAYFWLARSYGQQYLADKRTERLYGRVLAWIGRYGLQLVMVSRFIYGFRIAIPAACGATGMSPARFTVGDVIGAAVWVLVLGLAGYAIGHLFEYILDDVRRHEWWIAVGLLLGGVLAVALLGRDWTLVRVLRRGV